MLFIQRFVYAAFALLTLFLLFGSYPLALIPPGLGGGSYYVRLPSVFILTIVSFLIITLSRFNAPKIFQIALGVFQLPIIYHIFTNPINIADTIEFLGLVVVPMASCLYTYYSNVNLKSLALVGFALWMLLILYGFMNYFQSDQVVGITGNRNWMAISLLSLYPWSIFVVENSLIRPLPNKALRLVIAGLIVTIPGFFLIYHCYSRAAWLALGIFLLWSAASYFHGRKQVIFILTVILVALIAAMVFKEKLVEAHENDIRIPAWISTIQLVFDNPLLGVGPGNFTKEYTPYRAKSGHRRRLVAAEVTGHPHNEFLNLAANLGLVGALSWLALLFPLFFRFEKHFKLERLAQFSAFVIYFHSMLDKPLVQPPSNMLGLFCLGICWRPFVSFKPGISNLLSNPIRIFLYAMTAFLLFTFGLNHTIAEVRVGWHRRLAAQYKAYDIAATFKHYKKVVELDPHNIKGYYGAGAIALQKLNQPQVALGYLLEAVRLNPNYAHLNRLVGKAYATLGEMDTALTYFQKECALYPSDITSFRNYLACLSPLRHVDLTQVDMHLRKIYRDETAFQLDREEGIKLTRSWMTAVAHGDMDKALHFAKQLCRFTDYKALDPLIHDMSSLRSFPPQFLVDDFNEYDFQYWKSLLFRSNLLAEIKTEFGLREHSRLSINNLFQFTIHRFMIQPETKGFEWPMDAWPKGMGSSLAYSCIINWLCQGNGMTSIIYRANSDPAIYFPIVNSNENWYILNWIEKQIIELKSRESIILDDKTLILKKGINDKTVYGTYQQFCMPQEFFLKNQILSVLLNHFSPEIQLNFSDLPSVVFHETLKKIDEMGTKLPDKDFCIQAPFHQLSSLINIDNSK